jgi:hypothetical protein
VTAASEHAALDRERAETYLRLQAEAELRRALAMPEYRPPRDFPTARVTRLVAHRGFGKSGWLAPVQNSRRMRRRRAILDRLMRQQAGQQGQPGHQGPADPANQPERRARSLLATLQQAATSSLTVARSAATPVARQLRRAANHRANWSQQLRHSAWHIRRRMRRRFRRRGQEPAAAETCLERVSSLASLLAGVGAISPQTELDVVDGFEVALAARSRIDPEAMLASESHWMPRSAGRHPAPSGQLRAQPVGIPASGEIEGVPIRFYLGVLVVDQGDVAVTIRARFSAESIERDHRHVHPLYAALDDIRAVDDRGGTCHASFSGGGGDGKWDGRLSLMPAPPTGVRWLDMTLPGASVVRIPMDTPPADLGVRTQAVTTTAADRLLDALNARAMLAGATDAAEDFMADYTSNVAGIAADLVAAGVVTTRSESLRRLAGTAAHFGVSLPASLAGIDPADLPADWLSLHARARRSDGPTGIISVAAVLPEIEGTQCVIEELMSDSDSATMQIHARGWPEHRHGGGRRIDRFEWTARDDLGGWYLLEDVGGSYSDGEADLELQFTPALHPEARALDIILTGTTTQVTVSVPLDWQEGL